MKRQLIFICDTIYPNIIGGAEIFNRFFIERLKPYYVTKTISYFQRPAYQKKEDYIKIPGTKPLSIFSPIFIFFTLLFNNNKDSLVVLTFARSKWINWWPYPILKKIIGLKYIIIIHSGGPVFWKWQFPYQMLFANAEQIIGVSESVCENYTKATGINIQFIPPLIPFVNFTGDKNEARKIWGIDETTKLFLITGSIKQLKNPQTVVEAALTSIEKQENNDLVLFVFAGEGPMKESLNKIISQKKAEKNFIFLGNIPYEKINTLYAAADYYIISSDYEGTPLSMLEAMNNKLLILAADSTGINSIIINNVNGLLFPTKDSAALSNLILNIEKLDKKELRQNAFDSFNQLYSYDNMIRRYESIINGIYNSI